MVLIDYYKTLNIAFDAQADDIKTAYRQLAKKFHPDVVGEDEFYASRFKDINEAYEVLSDPKTRTLYNSAHKRFSKSAYAVGNTLVANGSRNNGALYAWHPAHRKVKQLLSKRQSLFLGLSIVFVSVVGASVFFGMNRSSKSQTYTDAGYAPPAATVALPATAPAHPALPLVLAEGKTVVSNVEQSAPVIIKPEHAAVTTNNAAMPTDQNSRPITMLTRKPALLPAVVVQPALSLSALPSPPARESPAGIEAALPGTATRYGYVVFNIMRNVQRAGIGNDTHQLTYVSGVSSYNALSHEDVARVMLDAEMKCSAEQSAFATSFSAATQTVTYRVESRILKPFTSAQAALTAMRREPKSNWPESSVELRQYGYLVFQVIREIHHLSGKAIDTQSVTYSTGVSPYGNLSEKQRAEIIVKADANCSRQESRYASSHSRKDDRITYRITGSNFKTFKTQMQAAKSFQAEAHSISLQ